MLALGLFVFTAIPASAERWDPATTISAYSDALANGDLDAALALFDDTGSATDRAGHTFSGRAGLTTFLRENGFGATDAQITAERLQVTANRALWTYTCSCASGSTEVRIVVNDRGKISVFFIVPPPAAKLPNHGIDVPVWLPAVALMAAAVLGLGWRRRTSAQEASRSASQGRLLAGLREARRGIQPPC
jgi:hypothetical protein